MGKEQFKNGSVNMVQTNTNELKEKIIIALTKYENYMAMTREDVVFYRFAEDNKRLFKDFLKGMRKTIREEIRRKEDERS